ncbi:MAG: DNA polymerase III subunit delta [Actinomycetota bacterium]|nr:MAG: DNA polymerase III subunit delta [Actinomycetota bacterium]
MAIAGSVISRATMIVGNDPALVYNALSEFIQTIEAEAGPNLERMTFQAGACSIQELVGSMSQTFMFSPIALIVLRDPSQLVADEVEVLSAAVESYSGENFLVLANFSGTVDAKLKSLFSARHALIDCSLKNKTEKQTFLGEAVHGSGLQFTPDAYRLLGQTLGEDVAQVMPILDLLRASLGEDTQVDVAVLEQHLSAPGDIAPWDFTDAIESGKVGEALEMLWRLMRAGKRHPLVIVAILQRRLTELALVSGAKDRNEALSLLQGLDKKFKKPPFVIDKMILTARALGYSRISQAMVWLSQADRQIKGEGGFTPELAVELLVARLAKSFSRPTAGQ